MMITNNKENYVGSTLHRKLESKPAQNRGQSCPSATILEARPNSFITKVKSLFDRSSTQLISLGLPLTVHFFVVNQANNLDILAVFGVVLFMVAYIAYQFLTARYQPENFVLLLGGSCVLTLFLYSRALPDIGINPHHFYSAIPAGWAALFSIIFLNSRTRYNFPCKAPLLFASTLVGIAVCLVIWYAGGKNCVLQQPLLAYGGTDRFPYTFKIWETYPISNHYFLTFDNGYAAFGSGIAYRGYTPLYTLLNYLPLRLLRACTGLEYTNLIRVTPFLMGACGALFIPTGIIVAFPCSMQVRTRFLFLTMISTAFLLLIPDLWTGPLLGRPDTAFPINAFFTILLSAVLIRASTTKSFQDRVLATGLLIILGLALPHIGLVFGIPLLLYWLVINKRLFLWAAIITVGTSFLSLLTLSLLGRLAGLSVRGTPILSRMGFKEHHLYSIIKAIITPLHQMDYRPWSFVLTGTAIGIVAVAIQAALCRSQKAAALNFLTLAPAIMMVIIFPQSVSIHPELYDISLAVGGSTALLFTIFAVLEEARVKAHRFLPWVVIFLSACMFENARKLAIVLLKFQS